MCLSSSSNLTVVAIDEIEPIPSIGVRKVINTLFCYELRKIDIANPVIKSLNNARRSKYLLYSAVFFYFYQ